MEMANWGSIR